MEDANVEMSLDLVNHADKEGSKHDREEGETGGNHHLAGEQSNQGVYSQNRQGIHTTEVESSMSTTEMVNVHTDGEIGKGQTHKD